MRTIKLYSPEELKKRNEEGFERAYQWYKDNCCDEIPWQHEIMDSFKAVFKASGLKIRDWSISAYDYSSVSFDMDSDVRDLSGNRAMAWLENNLLGDLRERRTFINRVKKYDKWFDFTKHNQIPDCPLTGVCFDHDFIDSLVKSIRDGDTLGEAYSGLAAVAGRMFESEIEGMQSEEEFLNCDHLEFTKEGKRV